MVIAAGAAQRPGETRPALLRLNVKVLRGIVPPVVRANPDVLLLVATNPVDALTYAALRLSGLPPARVLGSGTVLDTARLRAELSGHCGVDSRNVHAYVLSEHADGELVVWSTATLANVHLPEYCRLAEMPCEPQDMSAIATHVRDGPMKSSEGTVRPISRAPRSAYPDRRGTCARRGFGADRIDAGPRPLRHSRRLSQPACGRLRDRHGALGPPSQARRLAVVSPARRSFETDSRVCSRHLSRVPAGRPAGGTRREVSCSRGIGHSKLRVGDTWRADVERIEAVREAVRDSVELLVDANTNYSVDGARHAMSTFDALRVGWLEGAVPSPRCPQLSGGSSRFRLDASAGWKELLHAIRVPAGHRGRRDLGAATGSVEVRRHHRRMRIAEMAPGWKLRINPHTSATGLCMAATLHFLASIDNGGYYEADASVENLFRDELTSRVSEVDSDGFVRPPDAPGSASRSTRTSSAPLW